MLFSEHCPKPFWVYIYNNILSSSFLSVADVKIILCMASTNMLCLPMSLYPIRSKKYFTIRITEFQLETGALRNALLTVDAVTSVLSRVGGSC